MDVLFERVGRVYRRRNAVLQLIGVLAGFKCGIHVYMTPECLYKRRAEGIHPTFTFLAQKISSSIGVG